MSHHLLHQHGADCERGCAARPLPPSQPPGWIDPDPLDVQMEPVVPIAPRVRYQGWQLDPPATPHWFAWLGLGACIGIVVFALILTVARAIDPAPQSSLERPVPVPARSGAPVSAVGGSASPTPVLPTGAPAPTGAVGTALLGGWATYYATCSDCAAAGPLLQAALGPGWKGQTVTVVSDHGQADLRLVTSCACGDRTRDGVTRPTIIDVSLEAFGELSPSPAGSTTDPGYVRVSIEIPGSGPTLPPTDLPPHPDDERMRDEVRGDELYR